MDHDIVIPVLQEEADVQIRPVTTGIVRVHKEVSQYDAVVEAELKAESFTVEHVPVNLPLQSPVSIRQEGDTTIIPVMEEVVVVTKQLMLKEEIRITKHQVGTRYQETVVLQSEEVRVERVPAEK